jgi:hypothetical protein
MVKLTDYQQAHILQQDLPAFIETLAEDIRQRHPQRRDDDETLKRMIRVGIGRARKNGLHTDDQLWEYVRIMFEIVPNFDQEPRIRAMLDDQSLSIDDRWEALFETRFDDAWEAADNPAFNNPTYWYEEEDDQWSPSLPKREDLAYLAAWMYNQKNNPEAKDREPTQEEIDAALARMDQARANLPEIVATYNATLRLKAEHPQRTDLKPSDEEIAREVEEFFRRYPDYQRK